MEPLSNFDWVLKDGKIRDGRYGPVFQAMRTDTGEFITAERLRLEEPSDSYALESVVSHLENKQMNQSEPNVVSYLGYRRRADHIFILIEHSAGGTLRDFIQRSGAVPQPLVRTILRQIVLGLAQLHKHGFAVVFLDSKNILMGNDGAIKIEAPLLDVTIAGQPLPSVVLTLPELVLGQQNMRKADVWLLGIVAAQLLSGDCNDLAASLASNFATQIKKNEGSAWELLIPHHVTRKLDPQASDFLRQCLSM